MATWPVMCFTFISRGQRFHTFTSYYSSPKRMFPGAVDRVGGRAPSSDKDVKTAVRRPRSGGFRQASKQLVWRQFACVRRSLFRVARASPHWFGDRVLTVDVATGQPFYDDVIAFTNRCSNQTGNFLTIETASGSRLTLTPTHLVYASPFSCRRVAPYTIVQYFWASYFAPTAILFVYASPTAEKARASMVFASQVEVGHCVFSINARDGDGEMSPDEVMSVSPVSH